MSLAKPFNTRPLYQQVADEFIARIVQRTWAPGQPIENEAEIARSLGISLGTVRKAFDILTEHKLLERHQGKGTLVADFEGSKMRSRFSNIRDQAGNRISGEVEIANVTLGVADPDVTAELQVNARTPVLRFERRRTHLGRLFMIEDVYLRVDASVRQMSQVDLESVASARWTGQDLATQKFEKVAVEVATADDKRTFRLKGDAVVLKLSRIICSYQNRPLELRRARCHLGSDLIYATE
ncbi:GntR family transcriptional regulator [Aureimonas sp. AU12]|uniref:GntR family transcriptional regulator n=1 Tax=Aureimonas sp. AU12 TaxID=1638161 RepID=UPI0007850A7C|nr:GntR family transcriptional regulator [Aureimonas sp. AU12]